MTTPFQIVVMVSDENDNSPSFERQEYKVSPPMQELIKYVLLGITKWSLALQPPC